nr:cytochrome c oxidase assembly protein [Flexivirga meconopsidis]
MGRIPPPQYFEPTSIAQNFLGFDVTEPPGLLTYLTNWRPNLLFITLAVVAIAGYLLAVRRLHRRGDSWPVGRTISWVLGWLVVAVSTSSGMGRYAGVEFSVHMALHMTLNMLGPILMVLGGVVTLLLRASTPHAKGQPAGPHEWLTALMHSGFMRFMYHPFHVFAMFVGSYYVFYFTALFEETLRFHWAHQLAYLDFVMIGYLFYGLAIGVDQPPRPLPHLGKLAMILAAMPFHAFFGIVVMTRDTVIAETFYRYIDEPWMTDLLGDQYVGGGIAWAAGEFPLVIVIVALVLQWSREDSRIAKRKDRHLDSGLDTSHDAYNDMLAQLRGGRQREGSTHDRG